MRKRIIYIFTVLTFLFNISNQPTFAGPFADLQFVPTGGVNLDNAGSYLSLSNVRAVGGSWLTPAAAIQNGQWEHITQLAREASQLGA